MLDRVTIERALAKAGEGPLAVALSGGGDSVALLHLLADQLGAARVYALVVDHALRAGSAEDARRARGFAEALGVRCEILTLRWPQGPKRAQQAARRARFAALCEAARDMGARVIALAHTADDQAETVLMRAANGSGWRGLAGMAAIAPAPVWPEGRGVALARPLLETRRQTLRGLLAVRGAAWIEDPANANPEFERVRVRARLAAREAEGFDPMRLARLAVDLRAIAARVDSEAAKLIADAARFEDDRIFLARAAWRGDGEARRRALVVLLVAAAGSERAAAPRALARLEARIASKEFSGAALAGVVVSPTTEGIVLGRDLGALRGRAGGGMGVAPLPLTAGKQAVWDGRLGVIANAAGWSIEAAKSGKPVFSHGEERRELADMGEDIHASWLVEARVRHLLDFS